MKAEAVKAAQTATSVISSGAILSFFALLLGALGGWFCGGGVAPFWRIAGRAPWRATPASAEKLTGTVPELDRVAVRILVDNYQFAVAPSKKTDGVDIQHFGWGISDHPPAKTLISEFGLSIYVETERGLEIENT